MISMRRLWPGIAGLLLFMSWGLSPVWGEGGVLLRSPYDEMVERSFGGRGLAGGLPLSAGRDDEKARLVGGIAPHHDIAMGMLLRFYEKMAAGGAVRRVFLFAPDHFRQVRRWAAVCPGDWGLASGALHADAEAVAALSGSELVEARPEIFSREHGVTIHIPLIARFFPGATVVPILLRPEIPDVALLSLRKRILARMREGDILILSMDLAHYKPPEGLMREDLRTLRVLTEMRSAAVGGIDVDAPRAAALVLMLLRDRGARGGDVLERSDSSSILGMRIESGTSYATILFRAGEEYE